MLATVPATAYHQTGHTRFVLDEKTYPSATSPLLHHHTTRHARHTLIEHDSGNRISAEQFISTHFADSHGARLTQFMPRIFSLRNARGDIVGACGLRIATQHLFLERYLDCPIEQAIGEALGNTVERRHIVEVGQLAGAGAGAARTMIMQVTELLYHEGLRWVVFTGTVALRNAFRRLGLDPADIAAADPARLDTHERAQWGSYYDCAPRVQFGDIREGFDALSRIELYRQTRNSQSLA